MNYFLDVRKFKTQYMLPGNLRIDEDLPIKHWTIKHKYFQLKMPYTSKTTTDNNTAHSFSFQCDILPRLSYPGLSLYN